MGHRARRGMKALGGRDGWSASSVGREDDSGRGRVVALRNLNQQSVRDRGGPFSVQVRRGLLNRRRAYSKIVRVPHLVQMQGSVNRALERHHPEQSDEGEGEHAPPMRHGRQESQRPHDQGRRCRGVAAQTLP